MTKTAYVGVPCQIQALRKAQTYSKDIGQDWPSEVGLQIGLFCRENWAYTCFRALVEDDYGQKLSEVEKFDIKKGKIMALAGGETKLSIPLPNSKHFVRVGCQVCLDFAAELADISVGAVGTPGNMSTVIVRTKKGMDLLKKAKDKGYVEVKGIDEVKPGMGLVYKIHDGKKEENLEEAQVRMKAGHDMIHVKTMGETDSGIFPEKAKGKTFADLEKDVIDSGSCISCGTCATVCSESIEMVEERPKLKEGKDGQGCWKSYLCCPRTYMPQLAISNEILGKENGIKDDKTGKYIDIFAVKATGKNGLAKWQDGGAVTALLSCAMENGMIKKVVSVKADENWRGHPAVSTNIDELIQTGGTVYSYVTNIPNLKE